MAIEDVLLTIAEISLTFAGFTSLIVVIRGPGRGQWRPIERIAMWLMVGWSLAALFFALLPVLLFHCGLPPALLWGLSSGALGLFILVFSSIMLRRARTARAEPMLPRAGRAFQVSVPLVVVVQLLAAVDLLLPRGPATYLIGVIALLAFAVFPFVAFLSLIGSEDR
jgi:hypothetical protein